MSKSTLTTGSVYQTKYYGNIEIVDRGNKYDSYLVRFINTDTRKEFRKDQIISGYIRDPFAKRVCGVACTGDIKTKGKYKAYYAVWHDMINRCYNPNNKRYDSYKNTEVENRWLVFKNFYEDCPEIEGFDKELFESGELVLDKDLKQRFYPKKIYSKDACTWVSKAVNNKVQDHQQKMFYAKSPEGESFISCNISEFARIHNLNRKNISAVLHGKGKTVHGWRFSYEEIV